MKWTGINISFCGSSKSYLSILSEKESELENQIEAIKMGLDEKNWPDDQELQQAEKELTAVRIQLDMAESRATGNP